MHAEIILKYFPELNATQKAQFEALHDLYREWNAQINVISRKDIDELYVRHILHSLGIAKAINFKSGTKVLDLGTGGGFPGIPLAILFPDSKFYLTDSIAKKIKVVNAIVQSLGLKNVTVECIRAEQVKMKFDFVVSRAVTQLKPFYQWVVNKFNEESKNTLSNGILYLKGGDLKAELKEAKKSHQIFELSAFFNEEYFETKKIVYIPV